MSYLLLLALATKVCFGQHTLHLKASDVSPQQSLYAAKAANGCPSMNELAPRSTFQTQPWTFARTINILQGAGIATDAALQEGSASGEVALGQIRASLSTWTSEFVLHHPATGREIAKIVNPLQPWDTTQKIYNCQGHLIGTLTYPFDWKAIFSDEYLKRKVFDAYGNHVANIVEEKLTTSFFASRQHFVRIEDVGGSVLASMRHPTGGWHLKPFGEYFDTQIVIEYVNGLAPPPASNPEFVSLILANALASENRLGPYVGMIAYPVLILIVCIFCKICCCCMCACCGRNSKRESRQPVVEENEKLIEREVKEVKRDVWACCSRRQVVAPGGDAPTNKSLLRHTAQSLPAASA